MARMGRPPILIDKKNFEKLCGLHCTEEEIAYFYNCSIDTINNWCKKNYHLTFSDTYKKFSAQGNMSLRRMQFKLAEKSPAMAIFLGKNYLGQRDNFDIVDDTPLEKLDSILGNLRAAAEKEES